MPTDKTDVRELLEHVDLVPENIIDEAALNSKWFLDAINYRFECLQEKANAETDYERLSAETDLRIRQKAREDDEKITEAQIKAKILLDKKVSESQKRLNKAEVFEEYSKLVVECFRMKRDMIQVIKGLVINEETQRKLYESVENQARNIRKDAEKRFPKG